MIRLRSLSLLAAGLVFLVSCGAPTARTGPPGGLSDSSTSVTSVFVVVTATPLPPTVTATPNADATIQARVVATIASLPTPLPVPPTAPPVTPTPLPTAVPTEAPTAPASTPAPVKGTLASAPVPDKPQIAIAAISGTSFHVHATGFLAFESLTEDLSMSSGACALKDGQPCQWHFVADADGVFDHDADFSGLPSGQYWYSVHGDASARFAPTTAITISDPTPVLPKPAPAPVLAPAMAACSVFSQNAKAEAVIFQPNAMARCQALASIVNARLGLDSVVAFQATSGELAPSGATICGIRNNDGSYYVVYDYGLLHTYGHDLCQSI